MTAKVKKIMEIPLFRRLREYARKDGFVLVVNPILNFLQEFYINSQYGKGDDLCRNIVFF